MVLRHHNEAEALNAVQRLDWSWKCQEIIGTHDCEHDLKVDDLHIPMVQVSDEFREWGYIQRNLYLDCSNNKTREHFLGLKTINFEVIWIQLLWNQCNNNTNVKKGNKPNELPRKTRKIASFFWS